MTDKIMYTPVQFHKDIPKLAAKFRRRYDCVYPVPRGGIPVATALAAKLGIPVVTTPTGDRTHCLIVDDLVDSGKTRKMYPGYDFACLHVKPHTPKSCMPTYHVSTMDGWVVYWWETMGKEDGIEDNVIRILQFIGENPMRAGLIDTPARVAKMYKEFFCGYDPDRMPKIMTVPNGEDGVVYNEMLLDQGYFFSFCEHHMIPFFGQYFFGYIPGTKIIGASKIGRVIDYHAGRLQIAERLVNQVVETIDKAIEPLGQVLVMRARHLCKEMRGLKKWDSPFEAIAVRGYFAKNRNGCKDEFMSRIQGR
jgi:GTP cyclohydrolase I